MKSRDQQTLTGLLTKSRIAPWFSIHRLLPGKDKRTVGPMFDPEGQPRGLLVQQAINETGVHQPDPGDGRHHGAHGRHLRVVLRGV